MLNIVQMEKLACCKYMGATLDPKGLLKFSSLHPTCPCLLSLSHLRLTWIPPVELTSRNFQHLHIFPSVFLSLCICWSLCVGHLSLPSTAPFKTSKMLLSPKDWDWGSFSTGVGGEGRWAYQNSPVPAPAEILNHCSFSPWRKLLQGRRI